MDAQQYYYKYRSNNRYARLIGHIDLDEIDDNFCNQFIGYEEKGYVYYKLFARLIDHIDLDEVDDNFCNQFIDYEGKGYDYYKLFEYKYSLFIQSIVKCVKRIDHIKVLFKIFDIENNPSRGSKYMRPIIGGLINILNNVVVENISIEEISRIYGPLLVLISKNRNYNIDNLVDNILSNYNDKKRNELLSFILFNYGIKLNKKIRERLVKAMGDLSNKNKNNILYLNKFEDFEQITSLILQKLNNRISMRDEVFVEELTDNLEVLLLLINRRYFKKNKYYNLKNIKKKSKGSLTSSSRGILKIFERAKNTLKNNMNNKNSLSVVFFDELGLAEISNNNPLKVLHFLLENDDKENKVSFIGISNWSLDASKMNRGIHLSIPEPDKDDLVETANEIAKSYDNKLIQDYSKYLEDLSLSYLEYKYILKVYPSRFEDKLVKKRTNEKNDVNKKMEFHGFRDFYHLIKTISKLLIKNGFSKDSDDIEKLINISIERNFGGLDNSVMIFKEVFKKYNPNNIDIKEYNVMKCVEDNIMNNKNRYLLLVTKSSINQFIITMILEHLHKNYVFYYGSNFEEDTTQDHYSAKVLNKIQVTMGNENVMLLMNLTSLYPSLYDLFNQNFRNIDNKNILKNVPGKVYNYNKDGKLVEIGHAHNILEKIPKKAIVNYLRTRNLLIGKNEFIKGCQKIYFMIFN